MSVTEWLHELAGNLKVALTVSATTTTTGLGTVLEWIPNDIGKLATLVGILLSLVLIYTHWRKGRIEYRKTLLEIKILEEKEAERLDNARRRKAQSSPELSISSARSPRDEKTKVRPNLPGYEESDTGHR